jgi:DNA-binding NarL/FixJ family response regulator
MTDSCCCEKDHLTQREIEVLCAIACGKSSVEVGAELCISPRTVDHHIGVMLRRFGVHTRVDLVALCYAEGVLRPGEWPPAPTSRRCLRSPLAG